MGIGGACNGYCRLLINHGLLKKSNTAKVMPANFFLLVSVLANAVMMIKMKTQTNGLKKKNRIFPMMNMIKKRPAVGPARDFNF